MSFQSHVIDMTTQRSHLAAHLGPTILHGPLYGRPILTKYSRIQAPGPILCGVVMMRLPPSLKWWNRDLPRKHTLSKRVWYGIAFDHSSFSVWIIYLEVATVVGSELCVETSNARCCQQKAAHTVLVVYKYKEKKKEKLSEKQPPVRWLWFLPLDKQTINQKNPVFQFGSNSMSLTYRSTTMTHWHCLNPLRLVHPLQ